MKAKLFACAALVSLMSCGNGESPEARALFSEAESAYKSGDYTRSTELLDSLQKGFPAEVGIQREALALRPKVIEQLSLVKIAQVDSMTRIDESLMTDLKPQLKWVKAPEMIEGYWIDAKGYNPNFMNTTGIQARVSEIGQFYIVSSVNPSAIAHTSITVTLDKDAVTSAQVPYDGESNYRIDGGEVVTFSPEQSDTIGAFVSNVIASVKPTTANLTFNGAKGKKTVKLTLDQLRGIATAYRYSSALIRARDNQVVRQRLEKTIEIAKRQAEQAEGALKDK